jgi:hypothetical protein
VNGSIRLHSKHGVNPKLTYCPRCVGEGRDLILVGADDDKFTCRACSSVSFGSRKCLKCSSYDGVREKIGEHERLPGGLCSACETETEEHAREVAAGGVYFRCSDCGAQGVIRASAAFAGEVRAAHSLPAHAPCGVEFTKTDCPQCSAGETP